MTHEPSPAPPPPPPQSVKASALDQFSAASSAAASEESRAATLSQLLDRTLALQADNAAVLLGAIDILQVRRLP